MATFIIFLLVLCNVGFAIARAVSIRRIPLELEPKPTSDVRSDFVEWAQRAPVLTYSADGLPFVGSGDPIATWQFALPLRPVDGDRTASDPGFGTNDLIGHIGASISALGSAEAGVRRLPDLHVEDKILVCGRDTERPIHALEELLPAGLPYGTVAEIQADPAQASRHFLRCQVVSWDGELVTTVFVHCALQGGTLYMEFSSLVLPPTRPGYHVFGGDGVTGGVAVLKEALRAAAHTPGATVTGPIELVRAAARGIRNAVRSDAAPDTRADDCGARVGIRELGADSVEHRYFQYRDAIKYTEILERQVLEAATEFLRGRVDTTELGDRVATIVNNGVINYGKLNAGAVGAGAQAVVGAVGNRAQGAVIGGKA